MPSRVLLCRSRWRGGDRRDYVSAPWSGTSVTGIHGIDRTFRPVPALVVIRLDARSRCLAVRVSRIVRRTTIPSGCTYSIPGSLPTIVGFCRRLANLFRAGHGRVGVQMAGAGSRLSQSPVFSIQKPLFAILQSRSSTA